MRRVFAIPGLGRYFVQAVEQLDYTVIMGLTVFYGAFLVFMVIAVDILYGSSIRASRRRDGGLTMLPIGPTGRDARMPAESSRCTAD